MFQPSNNPTLFLVTVKAAFLVAVTSAIRVSDAAALGAKVALLTFFPDPGVLIPMLGFTSKVSFNFHLKRDCPSVLHIIRFCHVTSPPCWASPKGVSFFRCLCHSVHLFLTPTGAKKGQAASKRIVTAWLLQLVSLTYQAKGLDPPAAILAHQTHAMAASWAAVARFSMEPSAGQHPGHLATCSSCTTVLNRLL